MHRSCLRRSSRRRKHRCSLSSLYCIGTCRRGRLLLHRMLRRRRCNSSGPSSHPYIERRTSSARRGRRRCRLHTFGSQGMPCRRCRNCPRRSTGRRNSRCRAPGPWRSCTPQNGRPDSRSKRRRTRHSSAGHYGDWRSPLRIASHAGRNHRCTFRDRRSYRPCRHCHTSRNCSDHCSALRNPTHRMSR